MNRTKIICDQTDSKNEKSVGIRWNLSRHESHPITFVNSHTIQLFKIEQQDASLFNKKLQNFLTNGLFIPSS